MFFNLLKINEIYKINFPFPYSWKIGFGFYYFHCRIYTFLIMNYALRIVYCRICICPGLYLTPALK